MSLSKEAKILDLPLEILYEISTHLHLPCGHVKDFQNARLVCKIFADVFAEQLFSIIHLPTEQAQCTVRMNMLVRFGLSRFIKTLHVSLGSMLETPYPEEMIDLFDMEIDDKYESFGNFLNLFLKPATEMSHDDSNSNPHIVRSFFSKTCGKYMRTGLDRLQSWKFCFEDFIETTQITTLCLSLSTQFMRSMGTSVFLWHLFYCWVLQSAESSLKINLQNLQIFLFEDEDISDQELFIATDWLQTLNDPNLPKSTSLRTMSIDTSHTFEVDEYNNYFFKYLFVNNPHLEDLKMTHVHWFYMPLEKSSLTSIDLDEACLKFFDLRHFLRSAQQLKSFSMTLVRFIEGQSISESNYTEGLNIHDHTFSAIWQDLAQMSTLASCTISLLGTIVELDGYKNLTKTQVKKQLQEDVNIFHSLLSEKGTFTSRHPYYDPMELVINNMEFSLPDVKIPKAKVPKVKATKAKASKQKKTARKN